MKSLYSLSLLVGLAPFGAAQSFTASPDSVSSLPCVALDLERLEGEVGTITDGEFDLMVGGVRHSVRLDEQTKFRLDGKEATRAQVLVEGRHVEVELARGLATAVDAKSPAQAALPETVKGKIRSVGEESFVLMVDEEAQTISLSATTTYWLDGEEARKDQVLVKDKQVSVEITDGSATKVSARSSS